MDMGAQSVRSDLEEEKKKEEEESLHNNPTVRQWIGDKIFTINHANKFRSKSLWCIVTLQTQGCNSSKI
jgi:hypothetical protein